MHLERSQHRPARRPAACPPFHSAWYEHPAKQPRLRDDRPPATEGLGLSATDGLNEPLCPSTSQQAAAGVRAVACTALSPRDLLFSMWPPRDGQPSRATEMAAGRAAAHIPRGTAPWDSIPLSEDRNILLGRSTAFPRKACALDPAPPRDPCALAPPPPRSPAQTCSARGGEVLGRRGAEAAAVSEVPSGQHMWLPAVEPPSRPPPDSLPQSLPSRQAPQAAQHFKNPTQQSRIHDPLAERPHQPASVAEQQARVPRQPARVHPQPPAATRPFRPPRPSQAPPSALHPVQNPAPNHALTLATGRAPLNPSSASRRR